MEAVELKDRRVMLKVKAKCLADEARIIRLEERRARLVQLQCELHWHRVQVVRYEARATHLAYGLIRGKAIERIEQSGTRTDALWKKVRGMIEKYGPKDKAGLLELCKG